jgi:hypothetical protein
MREAGGVINPLSSRVDGMPATILNYEGGEKVINPLSSRVDGMRATILNYEVGGMSYQPSQVPSRWNAGYNSEL